VSPVTDDVGKAYDERLRAFAKVGHSSHTRMWQRRNSDLTSVE